ncbi:hypothetical protein [Tardiphaga sp.]|jgi:hypothetical protein|uniref:hypothetical protein n=1 Tax=Tardiphaga sp. TaxID=1926292 RepID=UPI0037D9AF56
MSYSSSENAARASAPARGLVLVNKADADLPTVVRALRITCTAEVTLKITPAFKSDGATPAVDADAVTITVPAGVSWEPIWTRRVWATGSAGTCVIHGVPLGA